MQIRITALLLLLCVSAVTSRGEEGETGFLGRVFDGLTLDMRTVEDTEGGIAVDFDWTLLDVPLKKGDGGGVDYQVSAALKAEGMLGSKPREEDNTPREINIGADLDWKAIYCDFHGSDYRAWLGVTAGEIEADQDWEQVNYVFQPFFRFDLPFSAELSKGLQWLLGSGSKDYAKPIRVGLGYSLVSEIEGEGERPAEDRFEASASYMVETYKDIQLRAKYRYFSEEDRDYDLVELTAGFPLSTNGSQLIVKYVDGSLPQSLKESESLSVGWSVSL